jgi:hypothetical protein
MMIYFGSWLRMIYGILWLKSIFCIGVYVDVSEHGATVYLYHWLFQWGQSVQEFVDPVASLQCLTLAKVM